MNEENPFEMYRAASLGIQKVEATKEKLTIFWLDGKEEEFMMNDLKKAAIITTEDGPLEPDTFWLLLFNMPIMVPSDNLYPGTDKLTDVLLDLPNFDHDKFIKAMQTTDREVFELWEKG